MGSKRLIDLFLSHPLTPPLPHKCMARIRKHVPYDPEYYRKWYAKNWKRVCERERARYRAKIKLKIEKETKTI